MTEALSSSGVEGRLEYQPSQTACLASSPGSGLSWLPQPLLKNEGLNLSPVTLRP